MVYGDSNIQANFSEEADTFSARLEQELQNRTRRPFQVINAGVVGYGMDQVLLKMKDDIPVWKPDIVIVNIFADNDYSDAVRNRLYYVDEKTGELIYEGIPWKDRLIFEVNKLYLLKATKTALEKLANALGTKKDIPEKFTRFTVERELESLRTRMKEELDAYHDRSLPKKNFSHFDLDIALDPDGETSRLKIKLMEKLLERIQGHVKAQRNIRILFTILPASADVSTNYKLDYRSLEKVSRKYRRDNLTRVTENILKRIGADYVNFYDTFLTDGKSPYYFVWNDNHWNDRGQALAAKLVAERLVKSSETGLTGRN